MLPGKDQLFPEAIAAHRKKREVEKFLLNFP